ncbi:MAG: preprotein translocase subunit SecA [Armatimonadota bacterium]
MNFLRRLLDNNERELRRLWEYVHRINALEPQMQSLTDEQMRAKTDEFRAFIEERRRPFLEQLVAVDEELRQLSQESEQAIGLGPDRRKSLEERREEILQELRTAEQQALDEILIEAFALVREASRRTIGLRHYDVQLIGGVVLHQGRIAEMKTGEGKTLVATLPLYLNALLGRGTHLVTHNDYLAKRDAVWMGPIFHILGLTVGVLQSAQSTSEEGLQPSYLYDPTYEPEDPRWRHLRRASRREAYLADVTYGIHSEFGFDYLRDNMVHSVDDLVQRDLYYAIVDEVDSILIDEARTPLIISGIPEESTELYYKVDRVVARLVEGQDFTVDEKARTAMLTDDGVAKVELGLGVKNLAEDVELMHHVNAALKARYVYKKDVDYVVKDGEVIIVDEFTGRLMFGRRYSDGLHQAIEAKEGVKIEAETQTIATITYQNYMRLYQKLAGMTGTAKTEEDEFRKIYGLDVVVIPTHLPMIRKDYPDVIYKTEEAKFRGICAEILQKHTIMQPVLVGSRSIDVSERLSERMISERLQLLGMIMILQRRLAANKEMDKEERQRLAKILNTRMEELDLTRLRPVIRTLGVNPDPLSDENIATLASILGVQGHEERLKQILRDGIPHNVLNAKYHEREAEIIAEAGRLGAVTIATNMAGRGVDIILGGKQDGKQREEEAKQVAALGGLHIIGSERHESRRIDNQLRGRAGRQGDPGSSRFYLSLEDELWRLFGDKGRWLLDATWDESEPIEHGLLTRAIERAQKKVEENNFSIRKHVLEYDDVMNLQRKVIYDARRKVLEGADLRANILGYLRKIVDSEVQTHCGEARPEEWDLHGLYETLDQIFPLSLYAQPDDLKGRPQEELADWLYAIAEECYKAREHEITPEIMRQLERAVTLRVVDEKWVHHLQAMDYLREGINLRAYAQIDPLVAFKKEAFEYFEELIESIERDVVAWMFRVQVAPQVRRTRYVGAGASGSTSDGTKGRVVSGRVKVGRNDPCPCGSGKKYKKCCLNKQ